MINACEDYKSLKLQILQKQNQTCYGEPQAYIALPNERSLEITHESYGLPEDEQFYSWRVHCSDQEFDNDNYKETLGVVKQTTSTSLAENECLILLRWAYIVAEQY